jgi:hypothetical protein
MNNPAQTPSESFDENTPDKIQPVDNVEEKPPLGRFEDVVQHGGFYQLVDNVQMKQPDFVQDGGHEIHPDLKGISFNFFCSDNPEARGTSVNYSGNAENAPWSHKLTGKVFENFQEAKQWLRETSTTLSTEYKKQQDEQKEIDKISADMNQ